MGDAFPNFKFRANELWGDGFLKVDHIHYLIQYLSNALVLDYKEENAIEQWKSVFQQTLDKMSERSREQMDGRPMDLVCIIIIIII